MAWLSPLLVLALVGSSAALLRTVTKVVGKEIATLAAPVNELLYGLVASQCGPAKKISGVTYEQIEGEDEPNLSSLTLEFTDPEVSIVYNITVAAERIPRARRFNPDQKLFILVSGYTDDPRGETTTVLRDALMSRGKCNVLALDTSSLTSSMYLRTSTYVRFIGAKLAEVLDAMVKNGLEPSLVHMIGFSLGAHVVAFAGKSFANRTGVRVGRITGLDPNAICFTGGPENRFASTDAEFVDVIHTDTVIGYNYPIGQADYFPNGAELQPNCLDNRCGHGRSWIYFAESVTAPDAFFARKCRNWDAFKRNKCEKHVSPMGYAAEPGTKGLYFLQTRGESPYGQGARGLRWRNND